MSIRMPPQETGAGCEDQPPPRFCHSPLVARLSYVVVELPSSSGPGSTSTERIRDGALKKDTECVSFRLAKKSLGRGVFQSCWLWRTAVLIAVACVLEFGLANSGAARWPAARISGLNSMFKRIQVTRE